MASVDWEKLKGGGEAKAKFRHCDEQKRIDLEHSNEDIDKTKTHLNMSFGLFEDGYDAVCQKYDKTIAELDTQPGANKRKDRVTCVGWELPMPKGMDEAQAREWMSLAYDAIKARYGDCVLGGTAHFDEVHEYVNPETGEVCMSRPHLHVYAIPIVDGRLHGKSFTARKNMNAMNATIEKMTQEHFPGFKFQTGTKKKSRKSVEELKNESAVREVLDQAQEQAEGIVAMAWRRYDDIEFEAKADAQELSDSILSDARKEAEKILASAEKTLTEAKSDAQTIRDEAKAQAEKDLEERDAALTKEFLDVVGDVTGYEYDPESTTLDDVKKDLHDWGDDLQKYEDETLDKLNKARVALKDAKALESNSDSATLERAREFMRTTQMPNSTTTVLASFEAHESLSGYGKKPRRTRAQIQSSVNDLYNRMNQRQHSDDSISY
jgi:vacuolar-type H+-ATPase subunit H